MASTSDTPSNKEKSPGRKGGSDTEEKKRKPSEYNARWRGYLSILISSLINLSSASNSSKYINYNGEWEMAVTFGIVTFALSFFILFLDRTKCLNDKIGDYTKAYNGKLEGWFLVSFIVWWVIGVTYQTQVNGIAYMATNIYFSSWLTLIACVHTLNDWSTEKDILSIEELTSISVTLPSWYLLLFGSMIVTGTSFNLWLQVYEAFYSESALGIALGSFSVLICLVWIMVHYNFIEMFKEGGWLELGSSSLAVLLWIVGCAVLTQEGSIAATVTGDAFRQDIVMYFAVPERNCTVEFVDDIGGNLQSIACNDVMELFIPGSNLYAGLWMCLGASLRIASKWKQQQAQNFAQAQNVRSSIGDKPEASSQHANNFDEDVDDFQDVDVF